MVGLVYQTYLTNGLSIYQTNVRYLALILRTDKVAVSLTLLILRLEILAVISEKYHCMKSACIRTFFWSVFSRTRLNMERYSASLHIQSECGKIRTRKTPNKDTFHAVYFNPLHTSNLFPCSLKTSKKP